MNCEDTVPPMRTAVELDAKESIFEPMVLKPPPGVTFLMMLSLFRFRSDAKQEFNPHPPIRSFPFIMPMASIWAT